MAFGVVVEAGGAEVDGGLRRSGVSVVGALGGGATGYVAVGVEGYVRPCVVFDEHVSVGFAVVAPGEFVFVDVELQGVVGDGDL